MAGLGVFWWLPLRFALIAALVIAFLIFLELFLANVRGQQILAHRASREEPRRQSQPENPGAAATPGALGMVWNGLTAPATKTEDAALSQAGMSAGDGLDAGPYDHGGDMGGGFDDGGGNGF